MKDELEHYFDRLWPICRSITGDGLRKSLEIIQEIIPLKLYEIPSGTQCFDWEIPKEWNIINAYILTPEGDKICDFQLNNLNVVNYSIPVEKEIGFIELKNHLHFIVDQPDLVPYITSYYEENWGFCISYNEYLKLPKNGKYKVYINSSLSNGSLTYGDFLLKGDSDEEILFATYLCHPSMAINELSGPLVTAFLYKKLKTIKNRKYSYRFIFAPETIGHIAYLSKYGNHLQEKLKAGFVITCVGHDSPYTYKKSKLDYSFTDKVVQHVLENEDIDYTIIPFSVGGSDERQYCSPGFNFPVGSLMRTPYKEYPEYHTSGDNKHVISFEAVKQTICLYEKIVLAMELNQVYERINPFCEIQLGKRGLYDNVGAWMKKNYDIINLLHFLAFCDGELDLIDISEKSNNYLFDFSEVIGIAIDHNLVSNV